MLGWFKDETELKKLNDFTLFAKYLQNPCKISFTTSIKWKYALLALYKYQKNFEIHYVNTGKQCLKNMKKHNQIWRKIVVAGMERQGVFKEKCRLFRKNIFVNLIQNSMIFLYYKLFISAGDMCIYSHISYKK